MDLYKHERKEEEFYCSMCDSYFLTYLRVSHNGEFTIECPGAKNGNPCKHHHYRKVVNGLITDTRCNESKKAQGQIIVGLAATLSKVPRMNDPDYRRSKMKQMIPN